MLRRSLALAGLLLLLLTGLAGCGGGDDDGSDRNATTPQLGSSGDQPEATEQLGFPAFATKNTTRVGGADAVANAAAAARAVYPGSAPGAQPPAVAIADADAWQAGLAAAVLMASPLKAPLLLSDGSSLPQASDEALRALAPTGVQNLGGMQVVRVGSDTPAPAGLRSTTIEGDEPAALAAAVDEIPDGRGRQTDAQRDGRLDGGPGLRDAGGRLRRKERHADPVRRTRRDPGRDLRRAARHGRPRIYLLGPVPVISQRVEER